MNELTIKEIKNMIETGHVKEDFFEALKNDHRKGVQKLMISYENNLKRVEKLEKQFKEMSLFERKLNEKGKQNIVGIDEAGRGPLAGPVVAAAVILPVDFKLLGLTDSKKLTEKKRQNFFEIIKKEAISYSISIVDNDLIDEINILEATKKAMNDALLQLEAKIDHVLIDAVQLDNNPYPTDVIIKGDQKSISIAAASILAKVTRDQIMQQIHEKYPMYHFNSNNGYGTEVHIENIKKHGITPYHRKSFLPVQKAIN